MTLRPERGKLTPRQKTDLQTKRRVLHAGERKVHTSPEGFEWRQGQVSVTRGWSSGVYTNIEGDSQNIYMRYGEIDHNNSGRVHDVHSHLIMELNMAAERAAPGKGAALKAGKSGNASVFYVEYKGRPDEKHGGRGNRRALVRLTKAIAEISSEFPYAIEPSIGDVSGEGDYVTTLVVWRE